MNQNSDFVIQTTDVSKTYRSGLFGRKSFQALKGVSLNVPRGTIYGLLGPNGAGKTTLIKILLGIVRKSGGTASVLGHVAGSRAARREVGYLPENHRIPRHLTANTALEYYGALSGLSMSEIRKRRPPILESVGLRGRERDRVSGYSKGMLQRLGLAQSMIHKPQLIVLDEPTDGVDPVGRREIRDVLKRLADEGHSVFLNSHLLQEIELVCESVAILNHGQCLLTGTVKDLKAALTDSAVYLQLRGPEAAVRNATSALPGVMIRAVAADAFEVEVPVQSQVELDKLIDKLRSHQISIWQIARREKTLEEVFMNIVGADRR
jgi:ABC-2 type transport system ATP-binding protein